MDTAIVIDHGSDTCRAGVGGESEPRVVFPSIVGYPKMPGIMGEIAIKDSYVGEEAQRKRGVLSIKCPQNEAGIITNWDDMELIWNHIFDNELQLSPEGHPVLMTESPVNPQLNREKMVELMFEKYKTPATFLAVPAVLSLFASGRTTGIVVDSGKWSTYIVPVQDGFSIRSGILSLPLAGKDLTDYLGKLLSAKGHHFTVASDFVCGIKEKLCYIALDSDEEPKAASSSEKCVKYELPDGSSVNIGDERFKCPEALFCPSLVGKDSKGVHKLLHTALMNCEVEIRKKLVSNAVLAGGSSSYPGFANRLKKEVATLSENSINMDIKTPPQPIYSAWSGGSLTVSFAPSNTDWWISKQDYAEFGPSAVYKKCF